MHAFPTHSRYEEAATELWTQAARDKGARHCITDKNQGRRQQYFTWASKGAYDLHNYVIHSGNSMTCCTGGGTY
jgi:hypothetical protein